jgi:hypothetical protein
MAVPVKELWRFITDYPPGWTVFIDTAELTIRVVSPDKSIVNEFEIGEEPEEDEEADGEEEKTAN